MPERDMVNFTPDDLERIRWCISITGQTYQEFIQWATMQQVDEMEATNDALVRRRRQQASMDWTS